MIRHLIKTVNNHNKKINPINLGLVILGTIVFGFGSMVQSYGDVQVDIMKNAESKGCEVIERCYSQSGVVVKIGETITWVNDGNRPHSVVSGSPELGDYGWFNSGVIIPNKSFSHKFTEQGQFFYFCQTHPWMKGIVMVR